MSYLLEKLSNFGFKVFVVPEAATILINSGFDPRVFKDESDRLRIQEAIFNIQLRFEEQWADTAGKLANCLDQQKPVLICDRGIMDIKAYLPPRCVGYFETLTQQERTNVSELMESYRGVIHLVTTANGAEEFYNLNNPARKESPEEARALDISTQNCWVGHSHLKVIDNSTDFENKMRRALAAVCRFLDIPVPIEIERKFLISKLNTEAHFGLVSCVKKIEIEQSYLQSPANEEVRIRKRTYEGSSSFLLTTKRKTNNPMIRLETEKIISHYDYLALSKKIDLNKHPLRKDRYCFLHENQYFELDFFKSPGYLQPLILLEIELTEENDKIEIPDWIKVEKEVTNDPQYSNFNLASNPFSISYR